MKYLSNYMEAKQTEAFKKAGAFFAFSQKQVDEAIKKNPTLKYLKLVNMGGGLICPKNSSDTLHTELDTIYKDSIKQDIEENGLNAIIKRELNNHEAYYTGNTESTFEALSDYPLTVEDINKVFKNQHAIV